MTAERPNCGPPPGTRPQDITTWDHCGECAACEAHARIDWSQVFIRKEPDRG